MDSIAAENSACWLFRAVICPLSTDFIVLLKALLGRYKAGQLKRHMPILYYDAALKNIDRCVEFHFPGPVIAQFMVMLKYDEALARMCTDQVSSDSPTKAQMPLYIEYCTKQTDLLLRQPMTYENAASFWCTYSSGVQDLLLQRDTQAVQTKLAEIEPALSVRPSNPADAVSTSSSFTYTQATPSADVAFDESRYLAKLVEKRDKLSGQPILLQNTATMDYEDDDDDTSQVDGDDIREKFPELEDVLQFQ